MTLGTFVQTIAAILIVGALAFGAYAWNSHRVLQKYTIIMRTMKANTGTEYYALMKDAPDMVCSFSASQFSYAHSGVAYIARGQTRVDLKNDTNGDVVHELFRADGTYVWTDNPTRIDHADASRQVTLDTSLFNTTNCSSWKYNPAAFELPTNIRTVEQ